jgi:hypothetical protein
MVSGCSSGPPAGPTTARGGAGAVPAAPPRKWATSRRFCYPSSMPREPLDAADGPAEPPLVAIDAGGIARPLGEAARAALIGLGEEVELLPSPARALVLRRVAPGLRGGCIFGEFGSAGRLHDLLATVAQSRWRGELSVRTAEATRSLFVHNGCVVGATSTAVPERLGALLVHFGEMTTAAVEQTARAVGENVRFGDAAVRLGFINRETLFRFLLRQSERIVYGAMAARNGTFAFFDELDESQLPVLLSHPLSALILEGARRIDEMEVFRRHVPSADHVPTRVPGRAVEPGHEAYATYLAVNGVRTVVEVAAATGQEEFDTTRLLYQLAMSGAVTLRDPRAGGTAGALAAFNDAMRLIFGSLDDNQSAREDVRASLASFAASSPAHDRVFRGAGPGPDGTFDVGRVLDNLDGGKQPLLDSMLHEYASFAIFIAEPALRTASRVDAAEVARQVAQALAPLAHGQ